MEMNGNQWKSIEIHKPMEINGNQWKSMGGGTLLPRHAGGEPSGPEGLLGIRWMRTTDGVDAAQATGMGGIGD